MGLFCDALFILQYHRTDSWQRLAFLQTPITKTLLNFSFNDLKEEKMFSQCQENRCQWHVEITVTGILFFRHFDNKESALSQHLDDKRQSMWEENCGQWQHLSLSLVSVLFPPSFATSYDIVESQGKYSSLNFARFDKLQISASRCVMQDSWLQHSSSIEKSKHQLQLPGAHTQGQETYFDQRESPPCEI